VGERKRKQDVGRKGEARRSAFEGEDLIEHSAACHCTGRVKNKDYLSYICFYTGYILFPVTSRVRRE